MGYFLLLLSLSLGEKNVRMKINLVRLRANIINTFREDTSPLFYSIIDLVFTQYGRTQHTK